MTEDYTESQNRVYINLNDGKKEIAETVLSAFIAYYNEQGALFPLHHANPLNALANRLFMEGLYRYGVEVGEGNTFRFNKQTFLQEMERRK